ncbi:MAG TPA: UDP-glucose 4-epimerase GalE [Bacillota bacterium]|nr:UDP-glucose 4-epimerase GalE [Bacillota bacterium]
MKILITGGAGFIGSVTATYLLEAGHDVIVVDNLSRGRKDLVPKDARFIRANVVDLEKVIFKDDQIDAVLHFAAYSAAGEAAHKPELYWHNNTVASLRLLDAMRNLEIKKLIFSSTCFVYGDDAATPITEQSPKEPTNPYGMSKLATDMAISGECAAHGLAAVSFRYFNVGGAYGACGELHEAETRIIPLALTALAEGRSFSLYGDDYATPDGSCIRDYIHVADLAKAHLQALPTMQPGRHAIYNLGNGYGFSNKEIIRTIEEVTGKTLQVVVEPRRTGDPAVLVASNQKAKEELGWVPDKPHVRDIIQDAWDFYQSRKIIKQEV